MSIITCRECGEQVSSKAEKCPSCGIKNPARLKNVYSIIQTIIGYSLLGGIAGWIIGGLSEPSNKAECELVSRSLDADVFVVNGNPDAGYRYMVKIKNNGEKGKITITAKISTSEGEFERKQTLLFDSLETKNLTYSFHEPTVNATNIQGVASCAP